MTSRDTNDAGLAEPAYRIDAFDVPSSARDAFLDRARKIQAMLQPLEGCRQNLVLAKSGGPGRFNVVTVVEWDSEAVMAAARRIVLERYEVEGFDPASFMASLGVHAQLGVYSPLR
jgi:Antibiotic biosynthesis monooxygenase